MMTAGEAVQSRYIIRTGVGETPVRYRLCMGLRDCYVERVGHGRPSHDCEGFFSQHKVPPGASASRTNHHGILVF